ncbi:MAG: TraB/GumN family protein [Novosphingobium sp.]|nr:TraB/GumN family protein [Novosphingobium sp.]
MDWICKVIARLAALLMACIAFPASAGEAMPEVAAASVAPAEIRPALWKITDDDTTIWLFGTIHALPPGLTWFDGKVAEAFAESDELITEIAGEEPAEMQGVVLQKAMLGDGKTLRGLMSETERADYEAALTSLGLPLAVFDAFEPWYAAVGLSTLPLMRDGFVREHGVEEALDSRAKELGHAHAGLETSEYQLGLFDELPLDVQKRYLSEVVENLPTLKEDLHKMIAAWKTGDAEGLAALMNAQEDDPVLVETLLVNRNRTWAGWISERMGKPGKVFLAVGAGHLAGAGSVQEQLVARGLTAIRVQ